MYTESFRLPSIEVADSTLKVIDRDAQRKAGIKTEALEEENFGPNWLQKADWQTYYQEVTKGMKKNRRDIEGFQRVLDAAAQRLSLPWKTSYFKDLERRRIIGGVKPYGALGHVFASGRFGHLVKHRKEVGAYWSAPSIRSPVWSLQ